MGKRRSSPIMSKVSNLIKVSIFVAKMRLVYLKKSTTFRRRSLKHYNSYGWLQEHQFSPSSTPLILRVRPRKTTNYGGSAYSSLCFNLSCFGGRYDHRGGVTVVADDENYSFESAIVEEDDYDDDSVDERAERFIERFYEEMKRQRRESSSSANFLEY